MLRLYDDYATYACNYVTLPLLSDIYFDVDVVSKQVLFSMDAVGNL